MNNNNNESELIIRTSELVSSHTHMIDEIKEEIKDMREDQKSLFKIASSVEIIANNMQNLKEGLDEVKCGQEKLGLKMDTQIIEVRNEQKNLDIKIQAVDNKSIIKFDVVKALRDNWYKWSFGIGGVSGIIYFVKELIK